MRSIFRLLIPVLFYFSFSPQVFSQEATSPPATPNSIFREQFYLSPSQKIHFNTFAADDLLVVEQPAPEWNSNVAIVSGFAPSVLKTQILKDAGSVDQAKEWIQKNKKVYQFEGVPVIELGLESSEGETVQSFWVGQKSFNSYEEAAAEVAMVKSIIESQGGNFTEALELTEEFSEKEEVPPQTEVKSEAQFRKEEEIALRWLDQLEIGEKLYGPFQGTPTGEPILYQSFGETTWRTSNFAEEKFNSQVGFWTQRLVFKGFQLFHFPPFNTFDPYVEMTGALESSPNDGGSQLDTSVGVEWRPLARSALLENFRPVGIPFLKWIKNYRFYVQYMDRRNLKDEIANIRDFDLRFGVDIFYEWGVEVPSLDQQRGKGLSGFLTDQVWGEYFGNYGWRHTNFTTNKDFDAYLLDTNLILGFKMPAFRLPRNSLIEEVVLMPYLRFSLIGNTRYSTPSDNRYYLGIGLRWMPFRTYRFQNNEWLAKTKIFAEYLGVGKAHNLKHDGPIIDPDDDWRVGVAFSLKRF